MILHISIHEPRYSPAQFLLRHFIHVMFSLPEPRYSPAQFLLRHFIHVMFSLPEPRYSPAHFLLLHFTHVMFFLGVVLGGAKIAFLGGCCYRSGSAHSS